MPNHARTPRVNDIKLAELKHVQNFCSIRTYEAEQNLNDMNLQCSTIQSKNNVPEHELV